MINNYKITIPEPCHEDWDKMTPNRSGRFCMNCSKTVIDFSGMSSDEIQLYLAQNQNSKICGSFKTEQLESLIIQIPNRILHTQTNYYKMFLLALFIAMGTTLFSCQDKEGRKQKIDKIEVVNDSSLVHNDAPKNSSKTEKKPIPVPVPLQLPPVIYRTTGELIVEDYQEPTEETIDYEALFNPHDLDILPAPENGLEKFYEYLDTSYTETNTKEDQEERLFISFVVEKDGNLSNFEVLKKTSNINENDIIRILKTAPKWIPGKLKDHDVRSVHTLPITFKK